MVYNLPVYMTANLDTYMHIHDITKDTKRNSVR